MLRFWAQTVGDWLRSLPAQVAREVGQDAKHALRLWKSRPLHTAFAVAVLAIAIGANTGVFSVLNALLLRSLPFERPDRLAAMRMFVPPGAAFNPVEFHAWRQASAYASDAFSYTSSEINIDGVSQSGRARLTETSSNFFSLLGTQPAFGRGFAAGEDSPGQPATAVIGYGLWQQLYGGDTRTLGSTIRLNGVPFTIVGIAPRGFDYPQKTAVWSATVFDYKRVPKPSAMWSAVARLRDGLTWAQARQAFEAEAYRKSPERRNVDAANRPALLPLRDELAGPIRQASFVLMAGVALLLLLACANIANFLLARTLARGPELSIRTALGASRARLVQQLLTETTLLALVAAALGLGIAWWTTKVAMAYQPAQLASQSYSVMDWQVLTFAVVVAVTTGLIFGAGPVLMVSKLPLASLGRGITASHRHARTRNVLIVAQIAVTIVLLTSSVALGRTFLRLMRVDNGYALDSVATLRVSFAGTPYAERGALTYYDRMVDTLAAIPGVTAVSATQFLPLTVDMYSANRFTMDNVGTETLATTVPVAPGYFGTLGGSVVAGREFTRDDLSGSERIAIVNEEFARIFGEPAQAVGRVLTTRRLQPARIVGVVRGMRDSGPLYSAEPQIYWPARSPQALIVVARTAGDVTLALPAIRAAAAAVDARVPVFDVKSMSDRLDEVLARPKFYATSVVFFGALGAAAVDSRHLRRRVVRVPRAHARDGHPAGTRHDFTSLARPPAVEGRRARRCRRGGGRVRSR